MKNVRVIINGSCRSTEKQCYCWQIFWDNFVVNFSYVKCRDNALILIQEKVIGAVIIQVAAKIVICNVHEDDTDDTDACL